MKIGLDLDNTLVCYDTLFWELAVEQGLIGPQGDRTKLRVKRELVQTGNEAAWTELQGLGYGPRMSDAVPYEGALRFVRRAHEEGAEVTIISHRSRRPYRGPAYDLHAAAREWLDQYGLIAEQSRASADVYLEESRESKLARIAEVGCDLFVDDLIAVLTDPKMPSSVARFLFDPAGAADDHDGVNRVGSWAELARRVFQDKDGPSV